MLSQGNVWQDANLREACRREYVVRQKACETTPRVISIVL